MFLSECLKYFRHFPKSDFAIPWNQNECGASEARRTHLLIVDVFRVHPAVELGQSDGQDYTGQQEEGGSTQPEPEGVLKQHNNNNNIIIRMAANTEYRLVWGWY